MKRALHLPYRRVNTALGQLTRQVHLEGRRTVECPGAELSEHAVAVILRQPPDLDLAELPEHRQDGGE